MTERTSPEDVRSLVDDETRVFAELPDDTWFYPGHRDDSTLGNNARASRSGASAAGEPTTSEPGRLQEAARLM